MTDEWVVEVMEWAYEVNIADDLITFSVYAKKVDGRLFDLLVDAREAGLAMEFGQVYLGHVLVGVSLVFTTLPNSH